MGPNCTPCVPFMCPTNACSEGKNSFLDEQQRGENYLTGAVVSGRQLEETFGVASQKTAFHNSGSGGGDVIGLD